MMAFTDGISCVPYLFWMKVPVAIFALERQPTSTIKKKSGFSSAEVFMAASQDDVITALEMYNEDGSPLSAEQLPSRAAFRGVKNPPSKVVRYQLKNSSETKWSILGSNAILDANGAVKMAELEREKFHEEPRKQEQIASFLDETNQALASLLDYPRTLGLIAKLAVPKLGDWCSTTIVEPGAPPQISLPMKIRRCSHSLTGFADFGQRA